MNIPKLNTKINTGKKTIRLPLLSDILPCFILFLAGRASVIGMYPFGMAMFCATFQKNVSYLGILSLILSGISSGCGLWTYKYILGAVLFWLYSRIREDYRKLPILSSLISGSCLFLGGLVLTLYYPTGMYDFWVICIESVLCAFFYVVFDKASLLFTYSRDGLGEQELVSGALCLGIFITGVSDIFLPFGINLASLITMYSIMSISFHEDLAIAGCGGLASGFICSMSSDSAITLMGFYGLSGIFSNLLSGFKKYGVALGFLGSAAVTLLYIGSTFKLPVSILEVLISTMLFIATPDSIHKKIGIFIKHTLHPEIVPESTRMREYLKLRLQKAANAFFELKENVLSGTERRLKFYNKDMCSIFDEVADRVCRKCNSCGKCFGENKNNTFRIIFSLLDTLESKGFCNEKNAPKEFLALCEKKEVFLSEFAHIYEIYKNEVISKSINKHNRDLLVLQYSEISALLKKFSDEINSGFCFLPELEKRVAEELISFKIGIREVNIINGADGITDVYVTASKNTSSMLLEEKLSAILKTPLIFSDTASGGMMHFIPNNAFSVEVYKKQIPKDENSVNGDTLICFPTDNHKYFIILCDGMGSGDNAYRESNITASMIECCLKAGFSVNMTLNLVNSSLVLKSDSEFFSSIDLLCLDLLSGQADFYKIGGSKSFFYREGYSETIFSDSLPSGILPESHISCTSKKITDGDLISMMSDGVCDLTPGFLSGERISKIIEKDPENPQNISEMILNSSLKKKCNRAIDDMSIVTIKISSAF